MPISLKRAYDREERNNAVVLKQYLEMLGGR